MGKNGYAGTSMRDLAQATGRSLAGLYHYFRNKEDLLYLINHRGFSLLLTSAERASEQDLTPEEKLYSLIYNHIHYFNLHRDEMRVMLLGTQGLDAKRGKAIASLKNRYGNRVQTVVEELHQHKVGTNLSDGELSRKTFLLFGMMNWIFGWYSPKKHGSEETLVNDIYLAFMGALATKTSSPNDIGISPKSIEVIKSGLKYNYQTM